MTNRSGKGYKHHFNAAIVLIAIIYRTINSDAIAELQQLFPVSSSTPIANQIASADERSYEDRLGCTSGDETISLCHEDRQR